MPSGGQISYVKIGYSTGSPHSWTTVPEVFDVSQLPQRIQDRIESTVYGTSGDKTYIGGLNEVQDAVFTVRVNLDAGSVHSQIRGYQASRTTLWWRFEVSVDPDFSTSTFVAYTMQGRISSAVINPQQNTLKTMEVTVLHEGNLYLQEESASLLS